MKEKNIEKLLFYTPSKNKMKAMPQIKRAAQFAPFAALRGFAESTTEVARLTDDKRELTQAEKDLISEQINQLLALDSQPPLIEVTYFEADAYKEGGQYLVSEGRLLRYQEIEQAIILENSKHIPVEDIVEIMVLT